MAQQTAVEWLEIQVRNFNDRKQTHYEYDQMFIQAKQIEKEQIINTYLSACARVTPYGNYTDSAEQYYNETFVK